MYSLIIIHTRVSTHDPSHRTIAEMDFLLICGHFQKRSMGPWHRREASCRMLWREIWAGAGVLMVITVCLWYYLKVVMPIEYTNTQFYEVIMKFQRSFMMCAYICWASFAEEFAHIVDFKNIKGPSSADID